MRLLDLMPEEVAIPELAAAKSEQLTARCPETPPLSKTRSPIWSWAEMRTRI